MFKTILTIVIVLLVLRILAQYQRQMVYDRLKEQERERQRYERMRQEQQHRRQEPPITVTRSPKKDDGDYIDYEEVK